MKQKLKMKLESNNQSESMRDVNFMEYSWEPYKEERIDFSCSLYNQHQR